MRPGPNGCDMQKWMASTLIILFLLPLVNADTDAPDISREATGGHAILLEHYTATWCDTCATVDPLVSEFVDDHSSRVVHVALHPNDHDPFGSALTTYRIGMKQAESELPLPTFWFDGGSELQGSVSQPLLANELRSAEVERTGWIAINMWWDTWEHQQHHALHQLSIQIDEELSENVTITVFRLETLEMQNREIAYNGIDVHDDVATQMISFDRNGTISNSFDGDHGWSLVHDEQYSDAGAPVFTIDTYGDVDHFVTVIEENGEVRGVIRISNEEMPRKAEIYSDLALLLLLVALAGSSAILRRDEIH